MIFESFPSFFHGNNSELSSKSIQHTFVAPMEYTRWLDTLATTISSVTSPENSSTEGTKCLPKCQIPEATLILCSRGLFRVKHLEKEEKQSVLC